MRTKFKAWAEPYINEHPEISLSEEKLKEIKGFNLEIGSGKADFLINMAKNYPDKFFVGVEKNVTCAGITAKKVVESDINNAKLIYADAINVLPLLQDESVEIIFLNFSDPWPKKRHHKRRLTSGIFLKEYLRVLVKGGKLIFKTDNIELFNDSLEYFQNSEFSLVNVNNDYQGEDIFDTQTEYETKKRKEGIPINRVIYQK